MKEWEQTGPSNLTLSLVKRKKSRQERGKHGDEKEETHEAERQKRRTHGTPISFAAPSDSPHLGADRKGGEVREETEDRRGKKAGGAATEDN